MEIKISVIIPIYNVGNYIEKTIESIIHQTFNEFELILVNDGSTDNSIEIAEGMLKDSKVKYRIINKENGGVGRARNTGIDVAVGKYIYFLDADDYVESTILEKMYNCAEENKVEVVFCGYTHISATTGKELLKVHRYIDEPLSGKTVARKILQDQLWICAISGFYLREFLINNNIYYDVDNKIGEDIYFAVKVSVNAKLVACVKEPLAYYVRRENSATKSADLRFLNLHRCNLEMLKFIKENHHDEAMEAALISYHIPRCIIRIFSTLAKSGKNKRELFNFIKEKEVREYLTNFKAGAGMKQKIFKIMSKLIMYTPSLAYFMFNNYFRLRDGKNHES